MSPGLTNLYRLFNKLLIVRSLCNSCFDENQNNAFMALNVNMIELSFHDWVLCQTRVCYLAVPSHWLDLSLILLK